MLRKVETTRRKKLEQVRRRIESGYYLTDEVARETARKMLSPSPGSFVATC
jgi:hypothetical protein